MESHSFFHKSSLKKMIPRKKKYRSFSSEGIYIIMCIIFWLIIVMNFKKIVIYDNWWLLSSLISKCLRWKKAALSQFISLKCHNGQKGKNKYNTKSVLLQQHLAIFSTKVPFLRQILAFNGQILLFEFLDSRALCGLNADAIFCIILVCYLG